MDALHLLAGPRLRPIHPPAAARHRIGRIAAGLTLAVGAGALLMSVVGLSAASAADPFVAGQRAARPAPLPDGGRAAVAKARRLLVSLGLHAPDAAAAERLEDRLEAATYDEVTFRDTRGRPILLVRLHADGSLRHLARLDAPVAAPRRIGPLEAVGRARAVAHAAGLRPIGDPIVAADPSSGWSAAWTRLEAGDAPVFGDGTWVRLDADGSVRSVASTVSRLAPRPADILGESEARRAAERHLDGLIAPSSRADVHVAGARLAWVAPNDTFAPARPDAPDPVRRLAWVVRVTATGPLAERLRGLELDLDAGSGQLLGGDTLE